MIPRVAVIAKRVETSRSQVGLASSDVEAVHHRERKFIGCRRPIPEQCPVVSGVSIGVAEHEESPKIRVDIERKEVRLLTLDFDRTPPSASIQMYSTMIWPF